MALFYVKRRIVSNVTIVVDIIGRTLIKYIMHCGAGIDAFRVYRTARMLYTE